MKARVIGSIAAALLVSACGGETVPPPVAPATPTPAPAPAPTAAPDPLGTPPAPVLSAAFKPPAPTVYQTANGMTVWLLERHALPLVAITVAIPSGGASDDRAHAGLAAEAADMLDEGAGKLDSVGFASAVDQIGARVSFGATADTSFAGIGLVKEKLADGIKLLGDAVVHPRFEAKEWKRTHDLWTNELKERGSDPKDVSHVVGLAALFGAEHPYGHPVDGLVASAPKVGLGDVKRFYSQMWRPDRAYVVVVGDVTRAELDPQLEAAFGGWKKPTATLPPVLTPPPPPDVAKTADGSLKIVFVDRPDAPQSIIGWMRPGVAESDPRLPPLGRVNLAIGGAFTSRLNQDLREAHGWTYGVRSRIEGYRGVGRVVASAAVVTDKTVDALKALLVDMDDFAHGGLKDDEVSRTRLMARNEIVEQYESVDHASFRLAHDAALGLPPDYEATASVAADAADKDALNKLAASFFDRTQGLVLIVGPKDKLAKPLADAGFTSIEMRDAEGAVIADKTPDGAKRAATAKPATAPKTK